MRLFVAVELSFANQQRLSPPVQQLVAAHASVLRAVPDGSAHITLAFIARADSQDLAEIQAAMTDVARHSAPFALVLSQPRVLRARQDPRLILLPVTDGAARVAALAGDLHAAIAARRPSLEVSPMKGAHVTLARFRKHTRTHDGRAVEDTLSIADGRSIVIQDEVQAIHLVESTLTSSGPSYRNVFSAGFR